MKHSGICRCGCCHRHYPCVSGRSHQPYSVRVLDYADMDDEDIEWRLGLPSHPNPRLAVKLPWNTHVVDGWIDQRDAPPARQNPRQHEAPPSRVHAPQQPVGPTPITTPNGILATLPKEILLLPSDSSLTRRSLACIQSSPVADRSAPFLVFGLCNNRAVNQTICSLFLHINVLDQADRDCAFGQGCRCNPSAAQFGALVQLSPTAGLDPSTGMPLVFHRYLAEPRLNFILIQTELLLIYRRNHPKYSSTEVLVQEYWGRFKILKAEIPQGRVGGQRPQPDSSTSPTGSGSGEGRRVTPEACTDFLVFLSSCQLCFRLLQWGEFLQGVVHRLLPDDESVIVVKLEK